MHYPFDPLYFLLIAPGALLAMWAQWRVHSSFAEGKQYRAAAGITGAQAAEEVMRAGGVAGVQIEPIQGFLSDHYDPKHKVLRLSPDVYYGQSLSAIGVGAHEAGHAIQDATHYPLLVIRNAIVPLAGIGSTLSGILLMAGIFLMVLNAYLGYWILLVGVVFFAITVVFQLVNLPVEFDASKRARVLLVNHNIISEDEDKVVKKVLSAAAMTYVAATLTAVLTLLYYLIRLGGGRRE